MAILDEILAPLYLSSWLRCWGQGLIAIVAWHQCKQSPHPLSAPWKNGNPAGLQMLGLAMGPLRSIWSPELCLEEPKPYCGTSCEQQLLNKPSATFRKMTGWARPCSAFYRWNRFLGAPIVWGEPASCWSAQDRNRHQLFDFPGEWVWHCPLHTPPWSTSGFV